MVMISSSGIAAIGITASVALSFGITALIYAIIAYSGLDERISKLEGKNDKGGASEE